MASPIAVTRQSTARSVSDAPYGVGIRVFTDTRLLRQIRTEIVRNTMQLEEIAPLENVTPQVLIALLDARLATEVDSGAQLRQFAASRPGFQVAAWRTSRQHPSKLHILDADGVALCGTPARAERAAVHSGPCVTCAAHAGLSLHQERMGAVTGERYR